MLPHVLFMGCVMNMANERYGMDYFNDMVERCYTFATALTEKQGHLIGTLCEYTPRELILAAGAWPVCLCGGDEAMIPAAETILPANICPLIKSTFGYSVNEANPFLQMASLTIAETTCDGKKKMYEQLMKRHPMYVLELPQKTNDPDAREHWYRELLKLRSVLEKHVGTTITDARLREAIQLMNRERRLRLALADLMQEDRPPLMGRELLNLKSLIAGQSDDLAAYERILANLAQRPRAERSSGNRPRVLLTGVPCPHCAERIVDLIEREGGLIVVQENCTGIKPILRHPDYHAYLQKTFPGVSEKIASFSAKYADKEVNRIPINPLADAIPEELRMVANYKAIVYANTRPLYLVMASLGITLGNSKKSTALFSDIYGWTTSAEAQKAIAFTESKK
jgi:benzoyl-CoA reductase/2-hydroxyglutaryl-CoA dehydratase subunit BcrC/BadD/HgdB